MQQIIEEKKKIFLELINQTGTSKNLIITGGPGVGKTTFLGQLKEISITTGYNWAGLALNLKDKTCTTEQQLIEIILIEVSAATGIELKNLINIFDSIPGLIEDKLKETLKNVLSNTQIKRGIIISIDEAHILKNHKLNNQYPLSVLSKSIAFLQNDSLNIILVLTGFTPIYDNLKEAGAYTEDNFKDIILNENFI